MSRDQTNNAVDENIRDVLIQKAHELFVLCDKNGNGIITKRDMQRLIGELPLTPDQLEVVFDSLDKDHNGYLSLQEFTDGFGMFLGVDTKPLKNIKKHFDPQHEMESILENIEEEPEDYEEELFDEILDHIGGKDLFKDEEHIRLIWKQLRAENLESCRKFESFLSKLANEMKTCKTEYVNLETALKNRMSQHDKEIHQLYEEMERQIKAEKERLINEENNKERKVRDELEREISQKEKFLQELIIKQSEMEMRLSELTQTGTETKQENAKLQKERDILERRLLESEQTVKEMERHLGELRQDTLEDKRKRAKAAFQVTEDIALERENLVKELDTLRSEKRKLLDEKDSFHSSFGSKKNSIDEDLESTGSEKRSSISPYRNILVKQGSVLSDYIGSDCESPEISIQSTIKKGFENEKIMIEHNTDVANWVNEGSKQNSSTVETTETTLLNEDKVNSNEACLITPSNHIFSQTGENMSQVVWKVKCIVYPTSISTSLEEEPKVEWKVKTCHQSVTDGEVRYFAGDDQEVVKVKQNFQRSINKIEQNAQYYWKVRLALFPISLFTIPFPEEIVDKKLCTKTKTQTPVNPERVFKIVFIGDSGVGKSSFIQRFCHNHFRPNYSATIGVDFQIRSVEIEGRTVALQLWDTAGQERFRSITKQYYRKADGVIIVYDVTSETSFKSVRGWINSIMEDTSDYVVMLLVGNKTDLCQKDEDKAVRTKNGRQIAKEYGALFYETSSRTGDQVEQSIMEMASLLQVREDEELERVLKLQEDVKKKCC